MSRVVTGAAHWNRPAEPRMGKPSPNHETRWLRDAGAAHQRVHVGTDWWRESPDRRCPLLVLEDCRMS